jgi:hypothetical protein
MKIYIFGPSCSVKSTLAQELQKELGSQWKWIDLIEQNVCKEEDANRLLDEKVHNCFIVDAQIPWRPKQEGELYFLVLPPLKALLQRDARRTAHFEESAERSKQAKKYALKKYVTFKQMSKDEFDACLDSSQLSVEQELSKIRSIIKKSLPEELVWKQ